MAPTEMIQTSTSSPLAQPNAPPSTPTQSPSEHIVTLNNVQQFIDMAKAIVAKEIASLPASKCICSHTPPESPSIQASAQPMTMDRLEHLLLKVIEVKSSHFAGVPEAATPGAAIQMATTGPSSYSPSFQASTGNSPPLLARETTSAASYAPTPCHACLTGHSLSQVVIMEHVQQIMETLKSVNTKESPPPVKPSDAVDEEKSEKPRARASRLAFKTVNEVWDAKAYKYNVVDSVPPPDEENELDRYIFVVRTRIDKNDEKSTHYIDIKSEGLRDVLRFVLRGISGICLREEKPSVEQDLLYSYHPDLETNRNNNSDTLDQPTLQHLDLLLDFIKKTYTSTIERIDPLLKKYEITYDLLWALFKPNTIVYTTCSGTGKPRCVNAAHRVGGGTATTRGKSDARARLAELLSEHLQKPLYTVSAGELGTSAEILELRLPLIFQRASRWKALLLLDEADVFLEQRSVQDIHRNALVCVFLRTLEYYQGIMFLTTNRLNQIDDAIASRIHFKIKYGNLGVEQRTAIWKYFLGETATPQGTPVFDSDDLGSLAQKNFNGREIKNLMSTAHALATQKGARVGMSHLGVAIAASQDFEGDFKGVGSIGNLNAYN